MISKKMEMLQAIRDWVKKHINDAVCRIDPDSILRKTGDASKVTNVFSKAAARSLPASGEKLGITLGKILKNLSDLKDVAFSGSYKDLSHRSLRLLKIIRQGSPSSAYTEDIIAGDGTQIVSRVIGMDKMWLVVGIGSTISTTHTTGGTDFGRVYLVVPKFEAATAASAKGRSFLLLQLGSLGSTARYNLTATAATGTNDEKITLTIPKGSHAEVALYELNCEMECVG